MTPAPPAGGTASAPPRDSPRPAPSGGATPSLRILVAGAGAIGQWLGLKLLQTGQDVTLLARAPHVAAIRANGLRVAGLTDAHAHVQAVADLGEVAGAFDCIALTCKAHQTAGLAALVAPRLRKDGVLLSLQNGLGNAEKLRRLLPRDRIAIGLTSHGVTVEKPGVLRHAGQGATLVGPFPGADEAAARTALRVLTQAGLEPEWQESMRGSVWRKALVNAGINPVGAMHGAKNGEILKRSELRRMCLGLVREAEGLAKLAKVPLPPGDLQQLAITTLERTALNKCSMLQDVEAKRPTEVEQLTGRLVRLGRSMRVAMPLNEAAYSRIKAIEGSYLDPGEPTQMAAEEMEWEGESF
ncbi:MAG TPA: ketopantoate reductase family protein [Candidatus Thermoplasmatota archaeon]|nr:ketopantoate reductase family protein [Candidatus Thermoplasmatota archaeon]